MIAIPRIGQEVIVDFLEGDPDRPVIVGRVSNAEQMPPYSLPVNMTQTGMKTRSTKNANHKNFNELRFEDNQGQEHIFIHAERNLELRTKNDRLEWIGHENHMIAEKDIFEKRNKDFHYSLVGNQNSQVGGSISLIAGEDWQIKINQEVAMEAGGEIHHKAGLNVIHEADGHIAIKPGSNIVIDAGAKLTLRVAGSFITIDSSGVNLHGPSVNINSGGSPDESVPGQGVHSETAISPREAMNSKGGEKSIKPKPPKPKNYSLQAQQFKLAAQSGDVFFKKHMAAPKRKDQAKLNNTHVTPKPNVITGLGSPIDNIVAHSASLQADLMYLDKNKWDIKYGAAGGGSFANKHKREIVLDSNLKNNPAVAVQTLAHEVGHAMYSYQPDYSSRKACVDALLADEGAATLNNIKIRYEILSNSKIDIGVAGNSSNHVAYNAAYNQFLKDGNAAKARQVIGQIFGNGEINSITKQPYANYYGGWYDKNFPKK